MRLFHMPVMRAALLGAAVVESAAARGGVRGCDRNFFVQEMGLLNWVRDRFDADVHLLLTGLNAANGGRQITVNFLAQKGYAGKVDTLTITTLPNHADDRVRRELLRTFQLGLAPYVARTPIASRLRVGLVNGVVAPSLNAKAVKDRWNLWLYRVDGNLSANDEQLVRCPPASAKCSTRSCRCASRQPSSTTTSRGPRPRGASSRRCIAWGRTTISIAAPRCSGRTKKRG